MNLGEIIVPSSQRISDINLSLSSLGRLLHATNTAHDPVALSGTPTRDSYVEKEIDTTIDDFGWFYFVNSEPKRHLLHDPIVHDINREKTLVIRILHK